MSQQQLSYCVSVRWMLLCYGTSIRRRFQMSWGTMQSAVTMITVTVVFPHPMPESVLQVHVHLQHLARHPYPQPLRFLNWAALLLLIRSLIYNHCASTAHTFFAFIYSSIYCGDCVRLCSSMTPFLLWNLTENLFFVPSCRWIRIRCLFSTLYGSIIKVNCPYKCLVNLWFMSSYGLLC